MAEDRDKIKPFDPCDFTLCKHFRKWVAEWNGGKILVNMTAGQAWYCLSCSKFKGNDNYKRKG